MIGDTLDGRNELQVAEKKQNKDDHMDPWKPIAGHKIFTVSAEESNTQTSEGIKVSVDYVIIKRDKNTKSLYGPPEGLSFYSGLLTEILGKNPKEEGRFVGQEIMVQYDDGSHEFLSVSYDPTPNSDNDEQHWAAYGGYKSNGWHFSWD